MHLTTKKSNKTSSYEGRFPCSRYEGVWEEQTSVSPHSLVTVLDRGEWSNSGLDSFIHAKEPWFSLNRKLGGPRSRYRQF